MQDRKPGKAVIILDSNWRSEGRRGTIISTTATRIVVEIQMFSQKETIELAHEQVALLDQIEPTTDGPFHTDDRVFIYESVFEGAKNRGRVGTVVCAYPNFQKCLVKPDVDEDDEYQIEGDDFTLYQFHKISLITPERRSPDQDYLRAIADAVPKRGYRQQYYEWWQQQADKRLWPIAELPGLYAAFLEKKSSVEAEIVAEIERQSSLYKQAFNGLTHVQKVEKWQLEWYNWIEYRSSTTTLEERLLQAIFGTSEGEEENTQQEEHPEVQVEESRDYGYRNSGSELFERCENYLQRLDQPKGYAYDRIPFRAVTNESRINKSSPQQNPLQTSSSEDEPFILPTREQALAILQDESENFSAALAYFACNVDDGAVATLLEKYISLEAREGFDHQRAYHLNNLALALLATRREEMLDVVIKNLLHYSFWGHEPECSLEGIMFKGSPQPSVWNERNPWSIRADEGVEAAIARIWAPVSQNAPRFVTLLGAYTLGLVLLKNQENGEFLLGYLHLVPFQSWQLSKYASESGRSMPTDTSISHLLSWLDRGDLCLLRGNPPRDPDNDSLAHLPGFRLPLALRELYAIHSGLGQIDPPASVYRHLSWISEQNENSYLLDRFHSRNLALLPDQFVAFAPDGAGNTAVFDLDKLDERLDPLVADWDHETWKVSDGEPFWQWFADFAPRSILGIYEYEV